MAGFVPSLAHGLRIRSARIFSNGLTRSEQAAFGKSKCARDRACSGKFFHSARRLRRNVVRASDGVRLQEGTLSRVLTVNSNRWE